MADALAPRMTSHAVDRRGHGASGDGPSFSIEREQEDIAAVLGLAGLDATLLGHSYGPVIALGLAPRQPPARLVLYEPPLPLDGPVGAAAVEDYATSVPRGDRDQALTVGLRECVRMPDDAIAALRQQPIWPRLAAMTPSWTREVRAIDQFGGDLERFRAIGVPVLLIVGGASLPWLIDISRRLALAGLMRSWPKSRARLTTHTYSAPQRWRRKSLSLPCKAPGSRKGMGWPAG